MIKIGQEIKIIVAASKPRWHLKIVSPLLNCWQYYNKYGATDGSNYGKSYYYRQTKDINDYNPCYAKAASYVIDTFESKLKVFVFPVSVVHSINKITFSEEDVYNSHWEILKSGVGKDTRYEVKKIDEPFDISESDKKLIENTIETTSLLSVLTQDEKKYVKEPYKKYNRFDILDI